LLAAAAGYSIALGAFLFGALVAAGVVAMLMFQVFVNVGVTVDIQTLDTAVVRTNYQAGNFMSTPSAWTNDMNDPTEIVNYAMRGGASTTITRRANCSTRAPPSSTSRARSRTGRDTTIRT